MKHTSGTWKAVRKTGTHIHRIISDDCQEIADTLMPYGLDENARQEVVEQAEANAALIESSPLLLKAVKETIDTMEHNAGINGVEYETNPLYLKLVDAYAKATNSKYGTWKVAALQSKASANG